MSARRRVLALTLAVAPLGVVEGCSLIAKYDPVDYSSPDGAPSPEAGGDASVEAAEGSADASDASTNPDQKSTADAAPDGPVVVKPPQGVLVVAGLGAGDGGNAYVLSVLAAASGTELSRERLPVVGLSYDGANDYWYIFETKNPGAVVSGGPYTVPNDPVVLHIRTLDTNTGTWTEVESTPLVVPTPASLSADFYAPLTKRFAYIAWDPQKSDSGQPQFDLVTIDVSNPAAPIATAGASTVTKTLISEGVISMMGTRAVGVAGGELNIVQGVGPGNAGQCSTFFLNCQFQLLPIRLAVDTVSGGDTATVKAVVPIGNAYPSGAPMAAAGGSYLNMGAPHDVVAFPSALLDDAGIPIRTDAGGYLPGPGTLQQFDPNTNAPTSDPTQTFPADAFRFAPVVFDECLRTAVVGETNGQSLFALPLTSGATAPMPISLGHPAAIVRMDPYTNTAFVSFNGGASKSITAYAIGGTAAAPTLSLGHNWNPPVDLVANAMAVRQPTANRFTCLADGGYMSN